MERIFALIGYTCLRQLPTTTRVSASNVAYVAMPCHNTEHNTVYRLVQSTDRDKRDIYNNKTPCKSTLASRARRAFTGARLALPGIHLSLSHSRVKWVEIRDIGISSTHALAVVDYDQESMRKGTSLFDKEDQSLQ